MWLFTAQEDFRKLKARVDELETAMRQLDLEWSSTYDKFRSILARIAKRQERDTSPDVPAAGFQEGDDAQPSSLSSLSERQREINNRILARRNRLTEVKQ